MASNSFSGRARVLERSRYEERVLIPGFDFFLGVCGAGGGEGKGEEVGEGGGVMVGIGMEAFCFRWLIFSLYASFSSLTSRSPSLL
jgi:hypothetical protein